MQQLFLPGSQNWIFWKEVYKKTTHLCFFTSFASWAAWCLHSSLNRPIRLFCVFNISFISDSAVAEEQTNRNKQGYKAHGKHMCTDTSGIQVNNIFYTKCVSIHCYRSKAHNPLSYKEHHEFLKCCVFMTKISYGLMKVSCKSTSCFTF